MKAELGCEKCTSKALSTLLNTAKRRCSDLEWRLESCQADYVEALEVIAKTKTRQNLTHLKTLKGVNINVGRYKKELVKIQKKLDALNKECAKISEDKDKLERLVESLRSKISILHAEGMSKKADIELEKLKVKKEVKK